MERRDFEEQLAGVVTDLGGFTAHDACERDWRTSRTNEQVGRTEFAFFSVEGGDGFAFFGVAHHDAILRELFRIKGVIRLADVEHDKVRKVDDLIDRPLSDREQEKLQPRRGSQGLRVFDTETEVATASFRFDLEIDRRAVPERGQ